MQLTSIAFESGDTFKRELVEEIDRTGQPPWCRVQRHSDFGEIGYGRPRQALRETHCYYWRLCALDAPYVLGIRATRAQLFDWMPDQKLASSEWVAGLTICWPRSDP